MSNSTALSSCKEVNVWQEGCSSVEGSEDCPPRVGEQRFVATVGQQLFQLTAFEYAPGTNSLQVHNEGLLVDPLKVVELSSTTFFLQAEVVLAGDIIVASALTGVVANVEILISDLSTFEIVLTDGQREVLFPEDVPILNNSIHINGFGVDDGRLVEGVQYTSNAITNIISLIESYPAGTILILTYNDEATPAPPIVVPDNTVWVDFTSTIGITQHTIFTAGATIVANYYDSAHTLHSGATFSFTGTTIIGKAGNIPDADGFFYDADGKQFAVTGDVNVEQFGAIDDIVYEVAVVDPALNGSTLVSGTDSFAAIQAAINFVGLGGVVKCLRKYRTLTELDLSNGATVEGPNPHGSRSGTPGIFVGEDINIFKITGTGGVLRNIALYGSGNFNLLTPTVVGTGIALSLTSRRFENVQLVNLNIGLLLDGGCVDIAYNGFYFNKNNIGVQTTPESTANVQTFRDCTWIANNYGVFNDGTGSAEQSGWKFDGGLFELCVRAIKAKLVDVRIDNVWFERTSNPGDDLLQNITDDATPIESLAGSELWQGEGNHAASTASGSLVGVGNNISFAGYYPANAPPIYKSAQHGDTNTLIEQRNDNIIRNLNYMSIPQLNQPEISTAVTITVSGTVTLNAQTQGHVNINNADTSPSIDGITSGRNGGFMFIINGTAQTITLLHEDAGVSAVNHLKLPGAVNFALSQNKAVMLTYTASNKWQMVGA